MWMRLLQSRNLKVAAMWMRLLQSRNLKVAAMDAAATEAQPEGCGYSG